MLNFSLMGAGRIGKIHANIINSHPDCNLQYIFDVESKFSENLAKKYHAETSNTAEEAIENNKVDAVLIASITSTHTDFITKASKAGKAVFCEKPIDLDINQVNICKDSIKDTNVPIQIGFNRRYDDSHNKLKKSYDNGEIGTLEMIVITSRDPQPPGLEYLKNSGGIFKDMTIHDFDLSRFILGDDPIVNISSIGSRFTGDDVKKADDYDTTMFILQSKKGVLIHINNSRRAVYGYDQRVEIFGSKGMIISNNQKATSVEKFTNVFTEAKDPILPFFIERYQKAYIDQFADFVETVKLNQKPKVSFEDGRNALIIANAAYESLKKNKKIDIEFN